MRTCWAILFVLSSCLAHAQNWALLNPAYRYNYSNDGTDTISNQIRVMDVDTLGVDSFRYELNLIGVVCDTCPASLGGPCDGCFVRVNQPQFLGYDCVRSGNEWLFNGADTFLIHSDVDVGTSWIFSTTDAITAFVEDEWPTHVLGTPDTLQRIVLSNDDWILLSCSFGILNYSREGRNHELIGVEGAGVGRLFPDVLSYFDYQLGDELTYREQSIYLIDYEGGPSGVPSERTHYWKVVITERTDLLNGLLYGTSVARTVPQSTPGQFLSGPYWNCEWTMPSDEWLFNRADLLSGHPILDAYPGQVVDSSACWRTQWNERSNFLSQTALSASGKAVQRSNNFHSINAYYRTGAFSPMGSDDPDTRPALNTIVDVLYEEGLGLRHAKYGFMSVHLVGAILSGDTIIPPPTINWTVGMEESSPDARMLYPNPADQTCFISGMIGSEQARVFDPEGRVVLTTQLAAERAALDVSDLAPGTYVVNVEGMRPQRLIIAR